VKAKQPKAPKDFAVRRFVVFSGEQFYPGGGWSDYQSSHATLAAARKAPAPGDWSQIVDLTTGQVIERKWESQRTEKKKRPRRAA
jgi:hypothetical protein